MVSKILKCEWETAASQGGHSRPRRLQGMDSREEAGWQIRGTADGDGKMHRASVGSAEQVLKPERQAGMSYYVPGGPF